MEFCFWAGLVQYICVVTISCGDHVWQYSFTWFPFGIWVVGNINRGLVARLNYESRFFIYDIVPQKNQVLVARRIRWIDHSWTESTASALYTILLIHPTDLWMDSTLRGTDLSPIWLLNLCLFSWLHETLLHWDIQVCGKIW